MFVATGMNYPDGLAGGPVAALLPGPLLLVPPTQLPSVVANELQRLGPDQVYVLGGTASVSDAVVNASRPSCPDRAAAGRIGSHMTTTTLPSAVGTTAACPTSSGRSRSCRTT